MKKKLLQNLFPNLNKKSNYSSGHQKQVDDYFLNIYEQIIENNPDVSYCITLPDFQIEYISPSIFSLTGKSREEIIGKSLNVLIEILHKEDRDRVYNHYKILNNPQKLKQHSISYRIKPPKGIYRWITDNHTIIFDTRNNSEKIVGTMHDITDQKLTEDALKRSRDRLFMAIEATNDGMWDWRLDSNEVYFDQRFYTMLGYEPYEFEGSFQEWMKRIHPEDIKMVQKQLEKHLNGKSQQWLIEYRFKARNDDWVWILNCGKVFDRDENDKPLRMVGTHSDITQRKKTELTLKQNHDELYLADEKLREANYELLRLNNDLKTRNTELEETYKKLQISEERFRQLAENTQDIFWLRDHEKIIYINPSFEKIWGHNREMVQNDPSILLNWIHPEDTPNFNAWVNFSSFDLKPSYIEQYRIIRPDGDIRWLWSRMFPIYNQEGIIYRVAGIATDITELKKFEEELNYAKEKALESDRLKSAFLANISHEIRTPMNGIIGFASLLKERVLPTNKREQFIDIITQSCQSLLHIIEDLVDISKLEANQLFLNPRDFNLDEMMESIYQHFIIEKQLYGKDHIHLINKSQFNTKPLIIHSDDIRIGQILNNLISNSFKFTNEGYITFGYKIRSLKSIEFFVSDTGIGISEDIKPFIYEQFRQHETTLTRKFGGAGLGLSICKGLIELFKGKIWFESSKDKGTTFYFTIPVSIKKEEIETSVTEIGTNTYFWPNKTVLIVEDDPVNIEYFKTILKEMDIDLLIATSGEDAIHFLSNHIKIDLILLDIRLPKMNGFDTFQKIKNINPHLPVIAQTAYAQQDDIIQCIEMGFSDYITKPINKKNLLFKMNYFLSKK